MKIQLINVAQKFPAWVDTACAEYIKRLPREISLQLVTVPLARRVSKQSPKQIQKAESAAIIAQFAPGSHSVACDEHGELWSSRNWSQNLQRWMSEYSSVNLIIGGPDGLADSCLQHCQQRVALGRMTMPHALVKIVVVEQLYRAWTILKGHPYHRQ